MKASWFTNRTNDLEYLKLNLRNIEENRGDHIAVLGQRKIGKTELLKKFVNENDKNGSTIICYVNFQSIISSLEVFTTRYVGKILFKTISSLKNTGTVNSEETLAREDLSWQGIIAMADTLGPETGEWTRKFIALVESPHADLVTLFERAMNFPDFLSRVVDRNFLVTIDEFHEIQNLTTFKELKKIDKLLFSLLSAHKRVRYLVSASQIDIASSFFNSPKSPFFSFFKIRELGTFTKEDSSLLVQKIFRSSGIKNFDPLVLPRIYRLSLGHPFSITAICREAVNIAIYDNRKDITLDIVDRAFVLETLSSEGRIFLKCDYILYYALNSVKGGNTLRAIILILAEQDGLKLKDISKKMNRPAGQVRGYILLMIKADLLVKKEDRYYFRNPLLRFWTAYQENYIRYNYGLSKELTTEIADDYVERFLFQTRQAFPGYSFAARSFSISDDVIFDGRFFGHRSSVKFPKKGERIFFAENDQTGMALGVPALIDFDFIYEVDDISNRSVDQSADQSVDQDIIHPFFKDVELKKPVIIADISEKSQMTESSDIDHFSRKMDYYKRKTGREIAFAWFICEKGFTKAAFKDAEARGIYLTDISKVMKLHEQLLRRLSE